MKREILFRGKTVNGGDWVESMTIAKGTIKRKANDTFMEICENKWVGIIPYTLGQYTGLTDKNGKKIFEDDIIEMKGGVNLEPYPTAGVIIYSINSFVMRGKNINKVFMNMSLNNHDGTRLKVIGNIHDNPELVK